MILTVLALALTQDNSSSVVQRMESFLKQHPSFEAKLKFSTWKGDHADGILVENRPSKVAYKVTFPDVTYQFSHTPDGVIETSSYKKFYDEYNSHGVITLPQSELTSSDWRMALPVPLFFNELKEYFPTDTKIESTGEAKVNGVTVDTISMKINRPHWKYTAKLSIDHSGKLVRYITQDPRSEKRFVEVNISDYSFKPQTPDTFKLSILPKGYTLVELPDSPEPLMLDRKLPSTKIADAATGEQVSLASLVGSNSMLVVVDSDWAASAVGQKALKDVQKILTDQKAGQLLLLCSDPGKPKSKVAGLNFDPTGKTLDILSIPSAPSFFLVGKKGTIERIWCGYNPSNRQFLPEVKAAIVDPEGSRPD